MQSLKAIAAGLIAAIVTTLLHQSLQPWGLLLGLAFTYASIWWVGRESGKKKFKALAAAIWLVVAFRAGTFGEGQEILIIGDGVGTALMLLGIITLLAATLRRI